MPPGWYPDPQTPGIERYWNGRMWSAAVRPMPGAPPDANAKANRRALGIAAIAVVVAGAAVLALSAGGSSGSTGPGYRVNADEAGIGFGWAARQDTAWRCSGTGEAIACLGGTDDPDARIDLAPGKRDRTSLLVDIGKKDSLVVRYDLAIWECDKGALGVVCGRR